MCRLESSLVEGLVSESCSPPPPFLRTVAAMLARVLVGVVIVGSLALPARAEPAEPADQALPLVVWKHRVVPASASAGGASVSHTLYLNDCLPDGCSVRPGFDSAQQDASSIANEPVVLTGYNHGADHWNRLVACVRATFAPFDIEVVTEDPGAAPHSEVMVAGKAVQLNSELTMAGGVAPFIGCGATEDNIISFVFANQSSDINYLCAAVAQESCHVWGLDHELDAGDPMTYLDLGSAKRFQNSDPSCGESLANPRSCTCGGDTQNSFQYLVDTFGLQPDLAPSTLVLAAPGTGQHVEPGFGISAAFSGPLSMNTFTLAIDGVAYATSTGPVLAFNGPTPLALGAHVVAATATDALERPATATATVHYAPACDAATACPQDGLCLGGTCYAHATVAGGLGATCAAPIECSSNLCGHDATTSLCTAPCESDRACPDGYTCRGDATPVCWPTSALPDTGGGGCATTGTGGSFGFASAGLLALLALTRRSPVRARARRATLTA